MYLIDATYFTREFNIPNINNAQSDTATDIESFGDEKPRLFMQNVLGYNLFTDFDTYVISGVFDSGIGTPQKWKDLVNGKEYTKDGKLVKWQGLLQTIGVFKKSLLTNYTYYEWLISRLSTVSGIGEIQLQGQNSASVNSTQRLVTVWNEFVQMYQGSYYNSGRADVYFKGFVQVVDWLGGQNQDEISLIQFLIDNQTDYPDANLMRYEVKNQLGL